MPGDSVYVDMGHGQYAQFPKSMPRDQIESALRAHGAATPPKADFTGGSQPSQLQKWLAQDPISQALGAGQKALTAIDYPARKAGEAIESARGKAESAISARFAGHPALAAAEAAPMELAAGFGKEAATMVADPKMWPFLLEGGLGESAVRPAVRKLASGAFAATQIPTGVQSLMSGQYAQGAKQLGMGALAALGLRGEPAAPPPDPLLEMYKKSQPVDPGLGPKQVSPPQVAPQQPVQTTPTGTTRTIGAGEYVMTPTGWVRKDLGSYTTGQGAASVSAGAGRAASDTARTAPPIQMAANQANPLPANDVTMGMPGRGTAGGTQIGGQREKVATNTTQAAPAARPELGSPISSIPTGEMPYLAALHAQRGNDQLAMAINRAYEERHMAQVPVEVDRRAATPAATKPVQPVVEPPRPASAAQVPALEPTVAKPTAEELFQKLQQTHAKMDEALKRSAEQVKNFDIGTRMFRGAVNATQDELIELKRRLVEEKTGVNQPRPTTIDVQVNVPKLPEGKGGLSFAGTKAIADAAAPIKQRLDSAFKAVREIVAPLSNARSEVQDVVVRELLGKPNRLDAFIKNMTGGVEKYIDKLPQPEQVRLFDDFMAGRPGKNDLESAFFKFAHDMNAKFYEAASAKRPDLPRVDNYFRLIYSDHLLPDGVQDRGFFGFFEKNSKGRAPFEGTKGFFQHKHYQNLSEALADGYVPYSYNMVKMFKAAAHDFYKWDTATNVWKFGKETGDIQFVKRGTRAPEGYIKVNDPIARVMVPVAERKLFAETDNYYVEQSLGTLINNFLSKDYVRGNMLGRSLLGIKNAQTMIELAGPYHLWTTSAHSIASELANGFHQAYNVGIRNLSARDIGEGLATLVKSPAAPWRLTRQGGKLRGVFENKSEFIESPFYKELVASNPEYREYADALSAGGAQIRMSEDFRLQTADKLHDALKDPNPVARYGKSAWYGMTAGLQKSTAWLFNEYIPKVKLASAAHDYYIATRRYASQLEAGTMSRETLARVAWERQNNFFGEKDFSSMFWNRNLKSAMQLMYRSVTWREGNLELVGRGAAGQLRALGEMTDHMRAILSGKGPLPKRLSQALPEVDPNLAYLAGSLAVTAAAATALQLTFTHKPPSGAWDLVRPQIGGKDSRGMPLRGTLPTYGSRDIPNFFDDPVGYLEGGTSATITRLKEIKDNQDWKGDMIYDVHASFPVQAWQQAWHLFQPGMVNVQTFQQLAEAKGSPHAGVLEHAKALASGESSELTAAGLSLVGVGVAPKRADLSSAQREALDAEVRGLPKGPKSSQEGAILQSERQLHTLIANHNPNVGAFVKQAMQEGTLSAADVRRAFEEQKLTWFQRTVSHLRGPRMTNDLFAVMDKATNAERREILPIVARKVAAAIPEMDSEQRAIAIQKLRGYMPKPQAASAPGAMY